MSNKKYVIIDLEMCNVPRSKRSKKYCCRNEIIEIGAALIDENLKIVDTFQTYVSPEFGVLDDFINNLTGNSIVLISTHIVEDVEACCESVLIASDGRIKKQGTVEQIQECAKNRIIEIPEEKIDDDNILFVEKPYIKEGKKMYRVITKDIDENGVEPTVEDGYLCLLKED